jgi:hypothetical protein
MTAVAGVKKVERGVVYFAGSINGKSALSQRVRPADGKKFTNEEIKLVVGGYFQLLVPAERGWTVYADEEGALPHKNYQPNGHTWTFAKREVYALNGCPASWRVMGNVLAVRKEYEGGAELPTVQQAMKGATP